MTDDRLTQVRREAEAARGHALSDHAAQVAERAVWELALGEALEREAKLREALEREAGQDTNAAGSTARYCAACGKHHADTTAACYVSPFTPRQQLDAALGLLRQWMQAAPAQAEGQLRLLMEHTESLLAPSGEKETG